MLIYYGFMVATAAGDESRYSKWMWAIKYIAIAIAGILLSVLIVRFVVSVVYTAAEWPRTVIKIKDTDIVEFFEK